MSKEWEGDALNISKYLILLNLRDRLFHVYHLTFAETNIFLALKRIYKKVSLHS